VRWPDCPAAKPKTLIETTRSLVRCSHFEDRPHRSLCKPNVQSLQNQGLGNPLMPHELNDCQIHQSNFLEDNPETQIADSCNNIRLALWHSLCQQKVRKWITTQFRLQHFARPGGREASFFDL